MPPTDSIEVAVTAKSQFRWTSAACTHVGLVRQINEDSCLDLPERGMWVVADGMGGHTLGDVASRMVVDHINQLAPQDGLEQAISAARACLQAVNWQLRLEAARLGAQIIGSTVVVLLAYGTHCGYLWAGDSRIYLYRNGMLTQLTRDHSQIEELRAISNLGPDELPYHAARNMITRAVGAADTLDPDEKIIAVQDGDIFLLCSDGLSNEVTDEQISSTLTAGNCHQAAEALLDMALKHGGRDNISAIVVRADDLYSTEKTALNPALS